MVWKKKVGGATSKSFIGIGKYYSETLHHDFYLSYSFSETSFQLTNLFS